MHMNEININPGAQGKLDEDQHPGGKWRRRGTDRRKSLKKNDDFVEKRTSGDRRYHILKRVSKIIFPRGKDSYDY